MLLAGSSSCDACTSTLLLQLHFVIPLLIDWHQRACTHGWKFRHRESTLHLLPLALVHSVVRSLAPWSPRPQIHHLELVLAQTPAPAPEPDKQRLATMVALVRPRHLWLRCCRQLPRNQPASSRSTSTMMALVTRRIRCGTR